MIGTITCAFLGPEMFCKLYEECLKQSLMVAAGINTNEKWESHGSDNGWIQNWKLYFDMDAI